MTSRLEWMEKKKRIAATAEKAHPGMVMAAMREMHDAEQRAQVAATQALRAKQAFDRVRFGIRGIDFCGCDHGCTGKPTSYSPFCETHTDEPDPNYRE